MVMMFVDWPFLSKPTDPVVCIVLSKLLQPGAGVVVCILEMDKFRNSGISEDQLRAGIKERFANERKKIIENARENLRKLNVKD
jgi:hypothetical protein